MTPPPQAAILPVQPFGTQSPSKFQYWGGGGDSRFVPKTDRRDDLVENHRLNPNNNCH